MASRTTILRRFPHACETAHKLARFAAAAAFALWIAGTPVRAAQPPEPAAQAAAEVEPQGETHPWRDLVARLVNFGILAGSLWYFLRAPIGRYLNDRGTQIRGDLVNAAATKQAAAVQIEEIDRKMKALPGELDALRRQGAQEMATEEQRIAAAAEAERARLLEQARREIELQVKVAERALVEHAADLAVGVAADRIRTNITDDDQQRLIDRYVRQLRP